MTDISGQVSATRTALQVEETEAEVEAREGVEEVAVGTTIVEVEAEAVARTNEPTACSHFVFLIRRDVRGDVHVLVTGDPSNVG